MEPTAPGPHSSPPPLDHSLALLTSLAAHLLAEQPSAAQLAAHVHTSHLLMKLEDCLSRLRDEANSADVSQLPSLILPTSELESLQIPTVCLLQRCALAL